MKRKSLIALSIIAMAIACNKDRDNVIAPSQTNHHLLQSSAKVADSSDTISTFITMTVANVMINSYLSSIHSTQNDSDITSFSVNADTLRAYLANSSIKNIKLMFAHTMAYINAGNAGVNAGYQSGALTIVLAAYDSSGNYVYYNTNMVLDHLAPCPYTCPEGNAGYNILE